MEKGESNKSGISRRRFLQSAIAGAAGLTGLAALARCQSQSSAPAGGAAATPNATAAGAAAAPKGTAPAQVKSTAKGNVKFLTWWWAETGRNDAWRALVKDFHAENPNITIEEVSIPFS